MQILIPALLLGSFVQFGAASNYGNVKAKTIVRTEVVTKYKTIKAIKTVTYTRTIQRPPGQKEFESYASYKGLTCVKSSKITEKPTPTAVEPAWVKNCPASVTLTAVPKCPAIRCMANPDCPVYDQAMPIEWDCRCKDRAPTTTHWVKPCPSCCPPPPIRSHAVSCLGKMSHLPVFTAEPEPVKGIAVGEPNPAAPKEDKEAKDEEPKEDKEEPKEDKEEPKEDKEPEQPKEDEAADQKKPVDEPAADEKKDEGEEGPKEDATEKAED
ncbi:hypothetical protein AOL_s00078g355 [Orbilia oligospora ATCC 24927]|uniref:Uncharacterized protein n=1 Tax=Arthrobotrys oligospora (strain ATCC 24927 / CBS 115.81 / DSM 1491) TaxID=756982 RepID=G1XBQ8_ARTOA|nr:hypothetical protein AOL_s00078g355 [Orbilia oligospora ATCC 24927]EGX49322.1 hypothetical protein AOL_s00078g355 [Orbilia oligospora ATCC 24927]